MTEILTVFVFTAVTQLITHLILKRTPGYSEKDKRILIYYLLSLILSPVMFFFFGWSTELIKGTAFMLILLYASVSDIQTHEVKDFVSVMILLTGLIGVRLIDLPFRMLGSFAVFIFLFVCAVASKNKLGGADVKLSAACAFLLGFQRSIAGLVIGLFLAVICNLFIIYKSKAGNNAFPLVPYLSVGFMLMNFF